MWALRQKLLIILRPRKMWCLCLRVYVLRRISSNTRVHACICFTYVTPCVILFPIQHGGAESALSGPHNAQTFFQLAGQVGLSGAWIYCKSDPDKTPTGSWSKGTGRERGTGRKLTKAVRHFVRWFPGLSLQFNVWPSDCQHPHQLASERTVIWFHARKKLRSQTDCDLCGRVTTTRVRMQPQIATHANIRSFLSGLPGLPGPEACSG